MCYRRSTTIKNYPSLELESQARTEIMGDIIFVTDLCVIIDGDRKVPVFHDRKAGSQVKEIPVHRDSVRCKR